jgi:hypothetical protein
MSQKSTEKEEPSTTKKTVTLSGRFEVHVSTEWEQDLEQCCTDFQELLIDWAKRVKIDNSTIHTNDPREYDKVFVKIDEEAKE